MPRGREKCSGEGIAPLGGNSLGGGDKGQNCGFEVGAECLLDLGVGDAVCVDLETNRLPGAAGYE